MMAKLGTILDWLMFALVSVVVFASPWIFGGWEQWWFWPFSTLICTALAIFLLRVLVTPSLLKLERSDGRQLLLGLLWVIPFLLYAGVRAVQAEVTVSAERSFLLFLYPVVLGVVVVVGYSRRQLVGTAIGLMVNFFCLGVYGVVNHVLTGSRKVMWADGFEQYWGDDRACGSYFVPDHFAGIMTLGFSMALGVMLARAPWSPKVIAAKSGALLLALLAVVCVVMSKSRGGGITLACLLALVPFWGFHQWPRRIRWSLQIGIMVASVSACTIFVSTESPYMQRFTSYFPSIELSDEEQSGNVLEKGSLYVEKMLSHPRVLSHTRPMMYAAATRAWETEPLWGIGAGMHGEVSSRFMASEDGDKAAGVWPTRYFATLRSDHVHSDWLQLLEEYGAFGFVLFVLPYMFVYGVLHVGRRMERDDRWSLDYMETGRQEYPWLLGASFAFICMTVYSVGDFNLHMPGTGWVFSVVLAIPLGLLFNVSRER